MPIDKTELLVVGAGPAGLGGALEAARHGVRVIVVDENALPGGQLLKQTHKFFGTKEQGAGIRGFELGGSLLDQVRAAQVDVRLGTVATGFFEGRSAALSNGCGVSTVDWERLLVATGAAENVLNFPGWTLPGVMGAGAAQTMMHIHRVLPGWRVLMVGSGNVGLIVAYQLLQAGASVAAVVERLPAIGGYAVHACKIRRMGVPIITGHTILEARGNGLVEEAVIAELDECSRVIDGTERTLQVDTVCIAVGLSPMVEIAGIVGCRIDYSRDLGGRVPWHGEDMQTSVPGMYVAGDLTGVEEASTALEEGRLAGLHIAASLGRVEDGAFSRRRAEIQSCLDAIRQGPFGERLRTAKRGLIAGGSRARGHAPDRPSDDATSGPQPAAEPAAVRRKGYLSEEEIRPLPGVPRTDQFADRCLAVLECPECIPCNPCEAACPMEAITVGSPITNLPVLDVEKCVGCGTCVAACPGLAIFVVDMTYSDTQARLMLPYEFLPLPAKGERVRLLDRAGCPVGEGSVLDVIPSEGDNRTPVVAIAVPKAMADKARWFEVIG